MFPSKLHLLGAAALLFSSLSTGCVGTPEAFAKREAKLGCINLEECDKAAFDMMYSDQKTCRDKSKSSFDDINQMLQDMGCEYQKDKARTCMAYARKHKKDCNATQDPDPSCKEVWKCPAAAGIQKGDVEISDLQARVEDAAPDAVAPFQADMYGIYQ